MPFLEERPAFEREFDAFYATYPIDISALLGEMDAVSARHPEWLPDRRKALIYETAAKHCDVQIFRHYPFYYEIQSGRVRNGWGFDGIGAWLKNGPFGQTLQEDWQTWKQPYERAGIFNAGQPIDLDHHCIGYDNVLTCGLSGLITRAANRLKTARTEAERAFLESTCIANRALIALSTKFATKANKMAASETDPCIRKSLNRIADTAGRVPASAPQTFYEALNTVLFMREASSSLEGIGVSILGHLDRMLDPFYQNDLAAGRITPGEARDLIRAFLAMTDAKFQIDKRHETSTTVMIGGCDAGGTVVFNDVTRMIVTAYSELRLLNPKLNARISPQHPQEYFDLLADLTAEGTNVLAIFNDDVLIEANVRTGKAVEDCRLYVSGGCQENVLQNTEINSRATLYLNLLQVFHMGLYPDHWTFFTGREDIALTPFDTCDTFEAFYRAYLHNLKTILDTFIDRRNAFEKEGWRYNPCPLHSATLSDCIENARDMVAGGARYSAGSVSLIGIGTLIDTLFAVKEMVFDHTRIPFHQLKDILAEDFEGEERLRQYLVNRIPKFGQDNNALRTFSERVFSDLADVSTGKNNARGGTCEASVFVYRSFVSLGKKTGATPDGRKAGEHLSQSMSPSTLSLGQQSDIGSLLNILEPLDLKQYPVAAVLDLKLPVTRAGQPAFIVPIIKRFLENGGSVLQLNVVDPDILLDARQHPGKHPDLVVRVSGFSARFNALPGETQEEVIHRTLVQ